MTDFGDPDVFAKAIARERWNWTKFGYEQGFPGICQFADIDAVVEFDGRALAIECKHHDGVSGFERLKDGQWRLQRRLVDAGWSAFTLYGDARTNEPWGIWHYGDRHPRDLRRMTRRFRREILTDEINKAMGR